jgi:hypothetical protein
VREPPERVRPCERVWIGATSPRHDAREFLTLAAHTAIRTNAHRYGSSTRLRHSRTFVMGASTARQ